MEDKNKKVSLVLKTSKDKCSYKFVPPVDEETFSEHYKNLMNNFYDATIELFKDVAVLRPATQEETDLHVYVFKTDDVNDEEHNIYKTRLRLYQQMEAEFSTLLHTIFPDINYIEGTRVYQQEVTFDKDIDIVQYKKDVKDLVKNVRDNYNDLLALFLLKASEQSDETESDVPNNA